MPPLSHVKLTRLAQLEGFRTIEALLHLYIRETLAPGLSGLDPGQERLRIEKRLCFAQHSKRSLRVIFLSRLIEESAGA
jgi:hypothetical protein